MNIIEKWSMTSRLYISIYYFFVSCLYLQAEITCCADSSRVDSILLPDVTVTSQLATHNHTPIAFTNIKDDLIEERIGNNEFVDVMKYTPSVHTNTQGGGWSDSEIFMRGFDNSNISVLINGIPVNDMENGSVYWSNWASMIDIASNIQIQRGFGVTKLCTQSVGGSVNIITKGFEGKRGGSFAYSIGNDGYNKTELGYNSGRLQNDWCISILCTYTNG